MTDVFNPEKRSEIMKAIRGKNTRPELALRKALFALGYRYRIHVKELPGCPDIVLKKWRTAIQVRGCFWHQHECRKARIPNSNVAYWRQKLEKNHCRDATNDQALAEMGWNVLIVWECQLGSTDLIKKTVDKIDASIKSQNSG